MALCQRVTSQLQPWVVADRRFLAENTNDLATVTWQRGVSFLSCLGPVWALFGPCLARGKVMNTSCGTEKPSVYGEIPYL